MMFTTFTKAVLAILAVFLTTASVVSAKDDYELWRTAEPEYGGYWEFGPRDRKKCYDLPPKLFHNLATFIPIQNEYRCILRRVKCGLPCDANCMLPVNRATPYATDLTPTGFRWAAESYECHHFTDEEDAIPVTPPLRPSRPARL